MAPILTSSSRFLPNLCSYSLTLHYHLSNCFGRLQDRLGTFSRYCIRTRLRPLSLSYVAFSPRHGSIVDSKVHQGAPFAQQCQSKVSTGRICSSKLCVLIAATVSWFSCIAAQRSASVDLGFAGPMCVVNWNVHSDQSLCSLVNAGAFANRSSVHER